MHVVFINRAQKKISSTLLKYMAVLQYIIQSLKCRILESWKNRHSI